MRRLLDWLPPVGVTVVLAAFFLLGLLWPLGSALIDAVHEAPQRETSAAGETLAQFASRRKLDVARLAELNGLRPDDQLTQDQRVVVKPGRWTLAYVAGLFHADAPQWRYLLNSLLMALTVTGLCALVSYPLAYFQTRADFRGKALLGGLLLPPLILPPFVGAIGLRRLLAKYGAFNLLLMKLGVVDEASPIDFLGEYRWLGCVLVMTLHFYPLLYLNLAAAIANVDPSLVESARSLGLRPWQVFRRVVLPLSLPGFVAGGSLVFIGAFTDLGTPLVFSYPEVVAHQIFGLSNEATINPAAPALVAVVTVVVLLVFALARLFLSTHGAGGGGVKGATRGAARRLSGPQAWFVIGLHLLVILLAVLPHISVFLSGLADRWVMTVLPESWTLAHVEEALAHPIAQYGVRNSLIYSAVSTLLDIALGLACAWVIVRRGGWWGRLLDGLALVPLAVPGLVLAFGYVAVYGSWYKGAGAVLPVGVFLILSYSIRRLPYTVRACTAGLEQTPRTLEEAASNLGAWPGAVLRKVTLPLIGAHIAAGAILAFAFAMLEVADSLILANQPQDYPLTKAIYHLFGRVGDGDQLASALGLFALFFLALSLLSAGAFMGRKWGEMFRT